MSKTLKFLKKKATIKKFLKEQDFVSIVGACHNACVWAIIKCKRKFIPYDLIWIGGRFQGREHSWLELENSYDDERTIFDLTVGQFSGLDQPYIGPVTSNYEPMYGAHVIDDDALREMVERVGI